MFRKALTEEEIKAYEVLKREAWQIVQEDYCQHKHSRRKRTEQERQRLLRAAELFSRALEFVQDIPCLLQIGEIYERLGRRDLAMGWYEHARRLYPDASDVAGKVANCALQSGDIVKALRYCRRAASLCPDHPQFQAHLARACLMAGQDADAIHSANAAIIADPDDTYAINTLKYVTEVVRGNQPRPLGTLD